MNLSNLGRLNSLISAGLLPAADFWHNYHRANRAVRDLVLDWEPDSAYRDELLADAYRERALLRRVLESQAQR